MVLDCTVRRLSVLSALSVLLVVGACGGSQSERTVTPPPLPAVADAGPADAAPEDDKQAARDRAQIAAVQKAVNDTKVVRHACWAIAAADDFDVGGAISLKLRFGENGQVKTATVAKDSTGDPVLAACLKKLYTKYTWPPVFRDADAIELPFSFSAPRAQYTVRYDQVVAAAQLGAKVGGVLSPTLTAHVLLDTANTGNGAAALTILEIKDGAHVPLHRHGAAELLYTSSGEGVVYGLGGRKRGVKLRAGMAVYVPAGTAHAFVHTGKKPAVFVQLYAPGGPEQRFKTGAKGGMTPVSPKELKRRPRRFPTPIVVDSAKVKPLAIKGLQGPGTGSVRILMDAKRTKDKAAYMGLLRIDGAVSVPAHRHPGATEILLITSGRGMMIVDGTRHPVERGTAIQIPSNMEHSFMAETNIEAIQFYTPSGPEQRFRSITK